MKCPVGPVPPMTSVLKIPPSLTDLHRMRYRVDLCLDAVDAVYRAERGTADADHRFASPLLRAQPSGSAVGRHARGSAVSHRRRDGGGDGQGRRRRRAARLALLALW